MAERIESAYPPSNEDIDFLTEKINHAAEDAVGTKEGCRLPFGFFIRDDTGKVIAGTNGYIVFGAICVDQLWVDEPFRKQGFASALLNKVHDLGRREYCKICYLRTMSFQAEEFYKKNGYTVDARMSGFTNDSEMISLHIDL